MRKIKLGITGCLGRMGQQLIKSSKKDKNFKLISLTEIGIQNKNIDGIKIQRNSEKAFKNVDVVIDFTIPKCTLEILKIIFVNLCRFLFCDILYEYCSIFLVFLVLVWLVACAHVGLHRSFLVCCSGLIGKPAPVLGFRQHRWIPICRFEAVTSP